MPFFSPLQSQNLLSDEEYDDDDNAEPEAAAIETIKRIHTKGGIVDVAKWLENALGEILD